ncbi:MAG: polysaccharide deacetylase family protein [Clostridia bacterium]|nr:polysaccharide deacetylase family protein [Clostridia bacterium]
MVIKLRKIHTLIFTVFVITVFLFANIFSLLSQEKAVSSTSSLRLPIVMYHHVTQNEKRSGKYVITTKELQKDFDYILEKGYTCVTVEDLKNYIDGKIDLPEKIIMITFDDGFESVFRLVRPLLKERKMKAVISPVGSVTELYSKNGDKNINYAYMTWEELAQAEKSDEFEVQSHTYNMHHNEKGKRNGLSKQKNETSKEYEKALTKDLEKMNSLLLKNSGIKPLCIVYPYGLYSKDTLKIIKKIGFISSFVCEERINTISRGNADCLFNLGRYNRPSGIETKDFFDKLL